MVQDHKPDQHQEIFMDILAEVANHVVAAEDLTQVPPFPCAIAAQPDVPRNVTLTITDANGSITAYQITVVGVDAQRVTRTEVFTGSAFPADLTKTGNIAFATITSVTVDSITGDDAGDILDVGIGSKLGLAHKIYAAGDVFKCKKNNAHWAAANYTPNTTYHTVDVSTGGAIIAGDDFSIWYAPR